MTREEVRDMFIRKGFNLREVRSPDYTVVEHRGETVGTIWEDSVNISNNYPSLGPSRWGSYANTPDTCVVFTSPMKILEDAIDFLLDSPRRIDRETRDNRVENVRKYFNTRKERQEMQEWMV